MINAQKLHGFSITKARNVSELNGTLYEMVHIKTGAKLCWLDNGLANKLFAISFTSLPEDDTGVFHILEHSVLCGSEKYPVKEPFVELLKSSLNTYLNAATYPDKTVYPVSSRNKQDYLNLVSVYLDAVFAPRFLNDRNIFLQEGWRIEEEDGKPCFKGVVYNEMKGALSDESALSVRKFPCLLFPDTPYGYISGGTPEAIRTLSYEKFIESYFSVYHPSNAYVYLDGSVPIEETLSMLDEYFSRYEKTEIFPSFQYQKPTAAEKTEYFDVKEGESAENKSSLTFGKILCDWKDSYKASAVTVLGNVLTGNNESPLKKALLDSGLALSVSVSAYTGGLQPFASVYVKGIRDGESENVIRFLEKEAKKILTNGIDRDMLHAAINRFEFQMREIDEPQGLTRCEMAMKRWQYGGDPLDSLIYDSFFSRLRGMIDTGEYENLLREIFLDKNGRVILHMHPRANLGEEIRKNEENEAQERFDKLSDSERKCLRLQNKNLKKWQTTPDSPEAVSSIPVLKLSEIDSTVEWTETTESRTDGVTVLYHPVPTQNIVYVNAYFTLTDFSIEELMSLSFAAKLFGKLPTKTHSLTELDRLLKTYTGKMDFTLTPMCIGNDLKHSRPCLIASFSSLRENLDTAFDLMTDILKNTLWDIKTIRQITQQTEINLTRIGILGGHIVGMFSVQSLYSATGSVVEAIGGGTYYRRVHEFARNFDSMIDDFVSVAKRMQAESVSKSRLTVGVTASEPCDITHLTSLLPEGSAVPSHAAYALSLPERIGMTIPAQINYAAQGYHLDKIGMKYKGSMKVAEKILSLNYFWNEIRAKGGAYGAGFSIGSNGDIYTYTYRDPSPAESLRANAGASEYLKDFCENGESIERYIISTVADDEPLRSPDTIGKLSDMLWITKYTKADVIRHREEILNTTREDLLAMTEILDAFAANGNICVVGHQDAVGQCGDLTYMEI